jgi:hypothetical protein
MESAATIFRVKVSKVRMESGLHRQLAGNVSPRSRGGESSENAVLDDRNGEQELWSF